MVKLTKIYTRTGDDGTTGLGTGARTRKDAPRVEAYGEVDEANAAIGVAIVACESSGLKEIADLLRGIQNDLFDVGADLCVPLAAGEKEGSRLRIQGKQTEHLERAIDRYNTMPALTSFVLPGGSPAAAALHVARAVSRRAERRIVTLMAHEAGATAPEPLRYINRVSDLLFVLARIANNQGTGDVLWVPGASREKGAM